MSKCELKRAEQTIRLVDAANYELLEARGEFGIIVPSSIIFKKDNDVFIVGTPDGDGPDSYPKVPAPALLNLPCRPLQPGDSFTCTV
jgi:hypothetical protein